MLKLHLIECRGLGGHPRASETSPFDRAHKTSYSTIIETRQTHIHTMTACTCTVLSIASRIKNKSIDLKNLMDISGNQSVCISLPVIKTHIIIRIKHMGTKFRIGCKQQAIPAMHVTGLTMFFTA